MTRVEILTVHSEEIIEDAFVVNVKSSDGRWLQHEGPAEFAYFTKDQAERLVSKVYFSGCVDEKFWLSGGTGYGTDEYEYALIEAEYYERAA